MTVVKRIFWKTGLLLLLAMGGCAALYGMSERADPPDIDWQTVTPAEVETLIESGELDPNEEFWWNEKTDFPPLMAVVSKEGNVDVLDVLVRHGADIDWQLAENEDNLRLTPLGAAVHNKNFEHARRLLELGADPVQADNPTPPVFYALTNVEKPVDMRKEMIELLLSYGADINAVDRRDQPAAFTLLSNSVLILIGKTPENYAGLLSYLVSHGADINLISDSAYGGSAMSYAVWSQDAKVIKELIALGGDVNLINDYDCHTPLLYFIQTGQSIEVFDALIAAGADLDYSCSDGRDVISTLEKRKAGEGERGEVLYFYTELYESKVLIDPDKFPTEQSWRDFADEITARIEDLCEETTYAICDEMETI